MSDRISLFSSWLFTHIPTMETINDSSLFHLRPKPTLLLLGEPGTGKSTLITTWLDQYQAPPPLSTLFDDSFGEPKPLLVTCIHRETPTHCARRLLDELGSQPYGRSAADLWQEVGSTLAFRRTPLLVLDQAERLSLAVCHYLQDYLYERTSCSLLFVATPHLLTTLSPDPSLSHRMQTCTITQFDTPL